MFSSAARVVFVAWLGHWWAPVAATALLAITGCTSLKSASDDVQRAPDGGDQTDEIAPDTEQPEAEQAPDAGNEQDDAAQGDAALGDAAQAEAAQGCLDPSGFSGLGCWRCAPNDISTLENACSAISCTAFDDKLRLQHLTSDGGLPELPAAEGAGADAAVPPVVVSDPASKSCAQVSALGKPVYVTGSSAVRPFLEQVARQLVPQGVYVIYTPTGSCVGVDAVINGTPMTTGAAPAPSAYALYWSNGASEGERCQLPTQGVVADLGISDVFVQSCPGFEVADVSREHVRDAHGPIQTMAFVVPASSAQREISAQAAYFSYGFGKDSGVLDALGQNPVWGHEDRLLQRQAASGTQGLLAAAIGVPASRWKGKPHRTSDELVASLLSAASDADTANQTLGILGADYIDSKNLRAQVRVLAFRDTHQICAVYPDSTETARDRQNVRDGHYPLWGPMHLLHRVNEDQLPANADNRQQVSDVLGYLSGTKALPNGIRLIDVYAQSGLVPECAMRVTRSMDGGNLTPKRAENPCACLFEARATGNTRCPPCKVQGDCASGETCAHGYCEP